MSYGRDPQSTSCHVYKSKSVQVHRLIKRRICEKNELKINIFPLYIRIFQESETCDSGAKHGS